MTTLKKLFSKKGNLVVFTFVAAFLLSAFAPVFFPATGLYKPEAIGPYLNNALPPSTPSNGGGAVNWSVVPAFPNLTFNSPLAITMYPDPAVNLMFVASRQGAIEYFDAGNPGVSSKTLLGDFTAETAVVHDGGFLGMAFHPDFAGNPNRRWVYLYYIANGNHVFNGESVPNNGPYSCDCECFSCATDGRWYGSYLRLARYDVTGTIATGLSINKASEKRMINLRLYNATHRGGGLVFGDDGYLYLTIGDQARRQTAQEITKAADNSYNVHTFEGGVVRLDVNIDTPSANSHAPTYVLGPESNVPMYDYDNNCDNLNPEPTAYVTLTEDVTGAFYRIPNDNPQWYPDNSAANDPDPTGYFEEFITVGHRAPHRMTKDKTTGDLWIGEVGSGSREEINALQPERLVRDGVTVTGGGNYGWPKNEGFLVGQFTTCGSNNLNLTLGTVIDPVVDFLRSGDKGTNAIIGGYVYRGSKFAAQLGGKYICGGHSQNRIFAISSKKDGNGKIVADFPGGGTYRDAIEVLTTFTPGQMITWGEDHSGELYIGKLGNNVNLYTLSATGIGQPAPQYLSQTGAFADLATLTPNKGVIPYDLIQPFWSDGAEKYRWMVVPNDGTHDTAAEKIIFSEDGAWQYPIGSVLIKHFEMQTSPGVHKRLETRFEVLGSDGNFYYLSYKWNEAGTDAELLNGSLDENLTVNGQNQVWHYPSQSECQTCHQTAVGSVLGPNTRNMNRSIQYAKTGLTANQLLTLSHLGVFDQEIQEQDLSAFLTLAAKDDEDVPLEFRARSYLDVNCAYCHQPATGNRANFDARLRTPLVSQQLVNGPAMDNLGIVGGVYIFPQSVGQSIIHHRINSLTSGIAMPPLAKNKKDDVGVQLIADWINSLAPEAPLPSEPGLVGNYFDGMAFDVAKFTRIDANVAFNWGNGSPDAAAVGNDQFSVRWTGLVNPQYSETYTFYTNTDDGVRLWINGQLVIDNWTDHAPTENSGNISLNAGEEVSLLLEYFENGGGAIMELSWSSASRSKQQIPAARLSHIPEASGCGSGGIQTLLSATFDSNSQGFTYQDDIFLGTSQPSYASGQYNGSSGLNGGGLVVSLGGVDNNAIQNMSGGYVYSLALATASDLEISFKYNLTQGGNYETDEYSQAHMSFDNVLYGNGTNNYLARVTGDGEGGNALSTGWQSFTVSLSNVAAGNHTLRIGGYNNKKTTSDESTTIAFDEVLITSPNGADNDAPVAVFAATTTTGGYPLTVDFNASASYDPNDDAISLQWDFGDGNQGSGTGVSHTYTTPGTYLAVLTVQDAFGCLDTESIPVNMLNNAAPQVAFTATPTSGNAPLVVLFEASATTDPESDPLTYHWDFGDGTERMTLTPGATHTYNYPGTYRAVLTVNDGFSSVQAEETITVDFPYSDLGIFLKQMDIGSVAAAGTAFHTSGQYTVQGSGADIWGTQDELQYIYRPYQRYGELIARVESLTNTNAWAKTGLMFRSSLDAGSAYAFVLVRPDQQVDLQWRVSSLAPGNNALSSGLVGGAGTVKYLRLVRLDNCFSAYYSTVAPTGPWTQVGTDVMIDMPEEALVGLATTSHNDGALASAIMTDVRLNSLEQVIPVIVNAKVYLQGPWNGSTMNTTLASSDLIPFLQPYDDASIDYLGNEQINNYPPDIVDWVLVQIRSADDRDCIIAQRAGFVRNDGQLLDLDGALGVDFGIMEVNEGYISILHRNHLGVMTQAAVSLR